VYFIVIYLLSFRSENNPDQHFIIVKFLKLTFGIRVVIGFKGMSLWLRVWLGSMINLVIMGALR
jgi:hypothetical protein